MMYRWGIVVVVGACARPASEPQLLAIEPTALTLGEAPPATLHGANLFRAVHIELDNNGPATLQGWQVRIEQDVIAATWIDAQTITIPMIPGSLSVGVHDVTAISPNRQELVLPGALTVTTTLAAAIEIPDLIACGAPFTATMTVTNDDAAAALQVAPTMVAVLGATLAAPSAPIPAAADIPPSSRATFTWTYAPPSPCSGAIHLQGAAAATSAASGTVIQTPLATSNTGAFVPATSGCMSSACAAAGGVCQSGSCVITVTTGGAVACPAGQSCTIDCTQDMTCRSGVDCSAAASCVIECMGDHSCNNDSLSCAGAGCTISCIGDHSCDGATIACTGTTCTVESGGTGCGTHSCGANGAPPCTCSGAGCQSAATCQ